MLGEAGVCVSVHGQGMGKGESLQWSLGSGHGQAHGPAPVGWPGLLSMWRAALRASGPGGHVRELRAGWGEPTQTVLSAQGGVRTSFPRRSFWLLCLESGWAHRGTRSFSINM